ncbi:MAG: copper resistance protein NlpE [Saprospiraceae bacterium]|nr:copper resistance protein NlpE [Saprospiraceae bacterium]
MSKNLNTTLHSFILVLTLLTVFCVPKSYAQQEYVGFWQLYDLESALMEKVMNEMPEMAETIKAEMQQSMRQMREQNFLELKNNGQYVMKDGESEEKGTWKVTANRLLLTNAEGNTEATSFNIVKAPEKHQFSDQSEGIALGLEFQAGESPEEVVKLFFKKQ